MKKNTFICSVKLDKDLKNNLENTSKKLSKSKSQIIREALLSYLEELQEFSSAINALEELKDGNYKKAGKKIDKVVKDLKKDDFEDFSFAIEALEELKDGNYKKAGKKIDKVVKDLKK